MTTKCPYCGLQNPLADAEGFTDEAPREYHAECWRKLQAEQRLLAEPKTDEQGRIVRGVYAGKTPAEVLQDRDDYNRIVGE